MPEAECVANDLCANPIELVDGENGFTTVGATTDGPADGLCETGIGQIENTCIDEPA